jgi:hypothetical protein
MLDLKRNNLDESASPYLQQHKDNPVWWQEWRGDVIDEAVRLDKPLFVSVGYSTCHWCHVMAAEAFSDPDTADYLNQHFIAIKVDREQRPDVDHFLMDFLTRQNGAGGWPLNAFLTPDLKPIYALTYAPVNPRGQMGGFLDMARQVYAYYQQHAADVPDFTPSDELPAVAEEDTLIKTLLHHHDPVFGGFGDAPKFPPHSTLLFLLYALCVEENPEARTLCQTTLDAMRRGGLTDHLQGGVFRYCVDRRWTIPHFEKMLYDQAMALWCYSLAYRVLGDETHKTMAEGILNCLEDSFRQDELFMTALDADTEHKEGATYLWRYDELETLLTADDFRRLCSRYEIEKEGNFKGKIHLVRKTDDAPDELEANLLSIRRRRPQPNEDTKILCGHNALTAIALIQAARCLDRPGLRDNAALIIHHLLELFWDGQTLSHSYCNGSLQEQRFLFDAAAMLIALTMLYEDAPAAKSSMEALATYLADFIEGDVWLESRVEDFKSVPASWFDHPIPSGAALAEMAVARYRIVTGRMVNPLSYRHPFQSDFYNIAVMMQNGLFHILTRKQPAGWDHLLPNTIQVRGLPDNDCYRGACRRIPEHSAGRSR